MPTLLINLLNQFNDRLDIKERIHTNLMIIVAEYPQASKGRFENMSYFNYDGIQFIQTKGSDFNKFYTKSVCVS